MTAIYFGTLSAMVLAALLPGGRAWGLDPFRFVSAPVLAALALAAVAPFFARSVPRPRIHVPDAGFFALASLAVAALFIACRARGHFLGDGYQSLALLSAERPYAKGTAPLTHFLLVQLKDALGGEPASSARLAYQTLSVVSGILFLGAVWLLGGRLVDTSRARRLLLLGLASGGWSLVFFGYVENYAPFITIVAAYALAGAWSARSGRGRGLAIALAGLAPAFHILGFLLWPSLLYFARGTRAAARRRWGGRGFVASLAVAGAVAVAGAALLSRSLAARTLFVPLRPSPLVPDGYSLFSAPHLLDFANLGFLLVPGIAVLAAAATRAPRDLLRNDPALQFLAGLSASTLLGIFVFDPKLGMPRDWDLFAFAGIPLALLAWLAGPARPAAGAFAERAAWLAIGLGCVSLVPRVVTNANEDLAYRRFRSHLELDHGRGRAARLHAVEYLRRIGAEDLAHAEIERWDRDYPERALTRAAIDAQDRGDLDLAVRLNEQALAIRPSFSDAWNNLGSCRIELREFEAARHALETAFALNPNEPGIVMNLGTLCYRQNDFEGAEKWWRRAEKRDGTFASANYYLARLAQRRGDDAGYERRLEIAAAAPSATPKMLNEWAARLEATGRETEAQEVRRRVGTMTAGSPGGDGTSGVE